MKQTTDYKIFKYKKGNRNINKKHVQKLKTSFLKHDFLPSCPIIVDKDMQTNVHGLFACGDCTGGLLQISKSVYEGAKAGLSAIEYLRKI